MNGTLTDVQGVRVGHVTRLKEGTGCTVVLLPPRARGSVVVRGGGPGARELQVLNPIRPVPFVHAILLTGGSAFGLSAADGVVRWLEERGVGHPTPSATVPIVPAAVLYDLLVGSSGARPDADDGYRACERATDEPVEMGCLGAGTGATVGKWAGFEHAMKGGIGCASISLRSGARVAALVAVNAIGDVVERRTGAVLAGARRLNGSGFLADSETPFEYKLARPEADSIQNTSLAVVVTNVVYDKPQLNALANMAHNGLARAVKPVNTPHDGDLVFAVSCGDTQEDLFTLGAAAADVVQHAVERAVRNAVSLYGLPGLAGSP